jgi:hypothetical protein
MHPPGRIHRENLRVRRALAVAVLAAAVLAWALPLSMQTVERVYSRGVYPAIQRTLTAFSNVMPFTLFDALLVGLPLLWGALIVRDVRRPVRRPRVLGRWCLRTAVGAAALYLMFLAVWGLNYRRLPLERKLAYDARTVTRGAAVEATTFAVSRLNALYAPAHGGAWPQNGVDASLVAAFAETTRQLGASGTMVPGRPKHTLLDVYFRRSGVAGMIDPFFLETLVARDLLPVERPFVVAHEWSHLAGFADEGEANFGGWLTCARAAAQPQYSGWLFLFGELLNTLPPADRSAALMRLEAGPRGDLRAIAARLARDVSPRVSAAGWRVYDRYLKANGVAAGAGSYAQVVRLVLGTRLGLTSVESASPRR